MARVILKTVEEIRRMAEAGEIPPIAADAPVYQLAADDPLWTAPTMTLDQMYQLHRDCIARIKAEKAAANTEVVSIRLDEDILAWFRAQGPGYQGRINDALRVFMEYHRAE